MENFVVSARKYRPSKFDEVVGQEHITTTLNNAIDNNHLAQALLFCGPRGVGKTTCARILARLINGFEDQGKDGNTAALNIYELDAASNNSVDDIRNLIDQVRYPPQFGKYKVYIIDEVHMLSPSAFNAFLKTLEEPPSYAIFILATTEKHKVIPTILSRCQIFDFNRIGVSDISSHLAEISKKENVEADPEALHLISQKADGALRDALSLFDLMVTYSSDGKIHYKDVVTNLHILDYDYYFKLTDDLVQSNTASSMLIFDEILKKGFDEHNFILGLNKHFRNLIMAKDVNTLSLLDATEKLVETYQSQASKCDSSFLLTALHIGNQCDLNYKSAKNQRLHVEVALMKMAHIPQLLQGETLVEGIKKKSPDLNTKPEPKTSISEKVIPNEEVLNEPKEDLSPEESPKEKVMLVEEPQKELSASKKNVQNIRDKASTGRTLKEIINLGSVQNSEESDSIKDVLDFEDKAVNRNELEVALKSYSENLEKLGKIGESRLFNNPFDLEDSIIVLKIENPVDEARFNDIKSDILFYLRKNLQNKSISLEMELVQYKKEKMIYTPQEKFEHLANKNPALLELKKRLGLEFEF